MERLGAGGFATVWRYHDVELESDVAVKALADNWAARHDIRERFLVEARILRQADSDHVVRVHDIGEVDGTPYFVMTYADQGTVEGLLEPGLPLPPARVAELIAQAGAGLSVLHDQGVLHRDIKPPNLLLKSDGPGQQRVLVADLGVAKAMVNASGLTQVVGTPAYMAPEQALGTGLDVRADVHALAAVAYQLLTARKVREGGIADLIEAGLPALPSSLAPLPVEVDDVLMRALSPDREQRQADVPTFVAELAGACDCPVGSATMTSSPTAPTGLLPTTEADPAPGSAEEPAARVAATADAGSGRLRGRSATAALFLLVLAVTFGLSYLVTALLR